MLNTRQFVRIIAEIVAIIIAAEVVVTLTLSTIAPNLDGWIISLVAAATLSVTAGPLIAWRVRAWAEHTNTDYHKAADAATGRAWMPAVVVLLLGLALSTVCVVLVQAAAQDRARSQFDALREHLALDIDRRLNQLTYGLRGARGAFIVSKSVERDEFHSFVNPRNLSEEFPGAMGLGFVQRVKRDELDRFVADTRADGAPNFAVRSSGDAPELMIVKFMESIHGAEHEIGLDIAVDPARRAAAEQAIRTDEPVLTAPSATVYAGEVHTQYSYLLPVFHQSDDASAPARRADECVGWICMSFSLQDSIANLAELASSQIGVKIVDMSGGAPVIIYSSSRDRADATASATPPQSSWFTAHNNINVGGREWTVITSTLPEFESANRAVAPWTVAAIGLVLTGALAVAALALGTARAQAVRMAHTLTGELRRLAEVAKRTTNAVIITDANRRIVWVNAGFTRISGYSIEEAMGRRPGSLLQFSKTDPATVAAMRSAFARGEGFSGEILNRGKDGREYWLDVKIQPMHDDRGTLTGFMAIETDITESRIVRERLRSIFSAVAEGIVLQDMSGKIIECNVAAEQILGLTLDQLMGRTSIDPKWKAIREDGSEFPGNDHPAMVTLRTGRPVLNEPMGICTPDGGRRWISVSTQPICDAAGNMTAVVASFADQTLVREQQRRMNLVVTGAGLGTWDWNVQTGATVFNERWAQMLGYDLSEIEPNVSTWERLVHPDDMPRVMRALTDHLEGRCSEYKLEHRLRRKDGSWAWVLDSGLVIERDFEGKPLRAAGIHLDMSASKELEENLLAAKQSAEYALREITALRSALDEHSILSVADRSGRILDVNKGFCAISGYTSEELIGQNHRMLNSGVHSKSAWVDMWRTIAAGHAWRGEVCNRAKNGSLYWVDSTIVPFIGDDGTIEKYVSIRFDITAQKAAEADLHRATAALEEAQAVARMGNWSFDLQTGVVSWSKQVFALFGRNPSDGTPDYRGVLADYAPDDASRLDAAVKQCLVDGSSYGLVMKTAHGYNDVRHVRGEGRARFDASGEVIGVFGTVADVTAEVEREEALREAQSRAEAASRSKSDFLANMSHEIRTPMTAILGYTELLAEHGNREKAPRERLEFIDTIKRNGEHLLSIINDILDVSKIEAGKLNVEAVPTSPDQIIHDVLSLMDVKANAKGIALDAVYENAIPAVITSDPVRLRQVLVNLVGNAVKFTEVGSVSIRVRFEPGEGGRLRFDVCDTGIGLSQEQSAKLFGAFVQADTSTTRRFGGTGLGLRISKSLAQMLGGDIVISSELGKGSRFSVSIATGPIDTTKMVQPGRAVVVNPSPTVEQMPKDAAKPLKGVRILLAEDGPDNVRLICFHLRRAGAEMRVAENGKLAVEALTVDGTVDGELLDPPPVDLVLTDMQMPEMDGYSATRLLRAKGCLLPIVAITAHAMSGDAEKSLRAGCDAHATKPIDKHSLIDLCRRAASGELLRPDARAA